MSIVVTCTSCGSVATVPDTSAGKRGKCRGCGSIVRVPPSTATSISPIESREAYVVSEAPLPRGRREQSSPERDELLFCEICQGRFASEYVSFVDGRVICQDCQKKGRSAKKLIRRAPPPGVDAAVWEVAVWERRVNIMALLSLLLGPFAIPFVVYVTYRLARALGMGVGLCVVGSLIPYLNILVVLWLNASAVEYLRSRGLEVRPFARRWQRKA